MLLSLLLCIGPDEERVEEDDGFVEVPHKDPVDAVLLAVGVRTRTALTVGGGILEAAAG